MRFKIIITGIILLSSNLISAQELKIEPKNDYIADNLDLNEVLKIYEESQNLQDFERILNFPAYTISNVDMDNDGKVDYFRVIEHKEKGINTTYIQSVIGKNKYEDVAYIYPILNSEPRQRPQPQLQQVDTSQTFQKIGLVAAIFLNVLDIVLSNRR